jgi:ribulose-phosphate 3-epimerase
VLYLGSAEAGYVTGQTLYVDGGWSALGLPDLAPSEEDDAVIMNPSLACGDWLCLKQDIDTLLSVGTEMFHIDIMDGHYVPNLCFPADVVRAVDAYCDAVLDVHLMTDRPEDYIEQMQKAGADMISFHVDETRFPISLLRRIRGLNMQAGIVLNPTTNHDDVAPLLEFVDYVDVMGVEPGFPGQQMLLKHTCGHLLFCAAHASRIGTAIASWSTAAWILTTRGSAWPKAPISWSPARWPFTDRRRAWKPARGGFCGCCRRTQTRM